MSSSSTFDIPRLSFQDDRSEIRAHLRANRPCVITGAMDGWAARDWTFESLRRDFGDHPVHAKPLPSSAGRRPRYRSMTLAAYFDLIASPSGKSWSTGQLRRPDRRLLAELRAPSEVLPERARLAWWIFVGSDSYTRLHYHPGTHALLAHLRGIKKLLLHPPDATPNMYPYPWYAFAHNGSSVEDHLGETPRFPRFARSRPRAVEVGEGEMLFIPVHFWHDGQSVGESITLTSFWRASLADWAFPTPGVRDLAHAALYAPVSVLQKLGQRAAGLAERLAR